MEVIISSSYQALVDPHIAETVERTFGSFFFFFLYCTFSRGNNSVATGGALMTIYLLLLSVTINLLYLIRNNDWLLSQFLCTNMYIYQNHRYNQDLFIIHSPIP